MGLNQQSICPIRVLRYEEDYFNNSSMEVYHDTFRARVMRIREEIFTGARGGDTSLAVAFDE